MIIWAAVLFVLSHILVGCVGSPARIAMMKPENLAAVDIWSLSHAYASMRSDKLFQELHRRNAFTAEEWGLIEGKKIAIGMHELALIASWGAPGIYGSTNRSIYSHGTHTQYVYRACDTCKATYVYVEDRKVTSWQD